MSDINTAVADSLKVLDLKRPIREADVSTEGSRAFIGNALVIASIATLIATLASLFNS